MQNNLARTQAVVKSRNIPLERGARNGGCLRGRGCNLVGRDVQPVAVPY